MRRVHLVSLTPPDAAAQAWSRARGWSWSEGANAVIGMRGNSLLASPRDLAILGRHTWRARRAPAGVKALALHAAPELEGLPEVLRVHCVFQDGRDRGNGVVEVARVGGRSFELRWREDVAPNGVVTEVRASDLVGRRLVVDPPGGEIDAAVLVPCPTGTVPGSEAVILPDPPDTPWWSPRARARRAAVRGALAAPWPPGRRPVALDALELVERLGELIADGARLELGGGPEAGLPAGSPSRLRLCAAAPTDPFAAIALSLRGAPLQGSPTRDALAAALRSDVDVGLDGFDAVRGGQGRADDVAPPASESSPTGGTWQRLEAFAARALPEDRDWFSTTILEPTRRRLAGGVLHDHHGALWRFADALAWPGEADRCSPAWARALQLLLGLALEADDIEAGRLDGLIAGFRPSGARFPRLSEPAGSPLTLLWSTRPAAILEDTWRWLLPRGSRIHEAPNRLDNRHSPLGLLRLR